MTITFLTAVAAAAGLCPADHDEVGRVTDFVAAGGSPMTIGKWATLGVPGSRIAAARPDVAAAAQMVLADPDRGAALLALSGPAIDISEHRESVTADEAFAAWGKK